MSQTGKTLGILFFVFVLGGLCVGEKVEYVRLPLLTLDTPPVAEEEVPQTTIWSVGRVDPIETVTVSSVSSSRAIGSGYGQSLRVINELIDNMTLGDSSSSEGDKLDQEEDEDNENESEDSEEFSELDLIELVQALERQADAEERTGVFPEILDILHGKRGKKGTSTTTTTTVKPEAGFKNSSSRIGLNPEGELELGSEDLSEFSEEIIEGISEGVEESLRMSDDLEIEDGTRNLTQADNATAETRQFSIYLFQGQYYAEPRLNRFIDGALRNMGTELRVASMDPLYFRVLPRGQVAERDQPLLLGTSGLRKRRPAVGRSYMHKVVKRQAFFRPKQQQQKQKNLRQQLQLQGQARQKKKNVANQVTRITNLSGINWLRSKRQQLQRHRRRRQRLRQQKIKQQQLKKNRNKKKQNQNKRKKQQLLNRIRRRIRQDVGGGRIEGLSKVQRDGDAEMQLFGNYTLIRSHMKMGPIEITMQIRTKNGIRRSGATLSCIRAHTVTRVNHEGSEMIDYLLDRPHPETIQVRGTLFPIAQRIARNIFARLFVPNSFLTSKLREKAALAFLSKPVAK